MAQQHLKLDESYEVNEEQNTAINFENTLDNQQSESMISDEEHLTIFLQVFQWKVLLIWRILLMMFKKIYNNTTLSEEIIEEYTPKLFSEEQSFQEDTIAETNEPIENESEQLFDQDINEEEDFEIPAFLRKQKF